jgi:hypothetical protein
MIVYIPWGLLAIGVSFYLFNEYNRVHRAKRDERREYLQERRKQLLENVLNSNKKNRPDSNHSDSIEK